MDEFEEAHATGEGRVFFRDKVPFPKYLLPLFLSAPIVLFAGATLGAGMGILPAAALALGVGAFSLFANMALMGLRLVVSEGGMDVHVGLHKRRFEFADIVGVELAQYRLRDYPLGRGQVKRGRNGLAFVSSLNAQGVKLTLKNGTHVFVQSTNPAALKEAILQQSATGIRVDASAGEHVEVEVEGEHQNEAKARQI